jgi:hypothetical protein
MGAVGAKGFGDRVLDMLKGASKKQMANRDNRDGKECAVKEG